MPKRNLSLTDLLSEIEEGKLDFRDLGPDEDEGEYIPASRIQEPERVALHKPKVDPQREVLSETVEGLVEHPEELVVSGTYDDPHIRQAGADLPDTAQVDEFRIAAERSLYVFAKAIFKKWWLYAPLHVPVCAWLTDFRGKRRRKLCMLPRGHGKSSIVDDTVPAHALMQPKESNIYMPWMDGSHTRILMACETIAGAERHIQLLESEFIGNRLLRALWPHRVWPGRPSKYTNKWNKGEFVIPRNENFPEPSVLGCGVGAAVTGTHPNFLIEDDLIGFPRCTSVKEMSDTIEWHETARNLVRGQPQHIEMGTGTFWTPADIYVHWRQDVTVDVMIRAAIENGEVIYPEQGTQEDGTKIGFTLEDLRAEQQKNPVLFQLNYMNNPVAREIVDFPREALRFLELGGSEAEGWELSFEEDERDIAILNATKNHTPVADETGRFMAGVPFTPEVQAAFYASLAKGTAVRFRG